MFLQVRWPNQQCQSTEGGWLAIQIALNLTRLISPRYNNATCMHIQDNDTQRNLSTVSGPSEMKQNLVWQWRRCNYRSHRCCQSWHCAVDSTATNCLNRPVRDWSRHSAPRPHCDASAALSARNRLPMQCFQPSQTWPQQQFQSVRQHATIYQVLKTEMKEKWHKIQ